MVSDDEILNVYMLGFKHELYSNDSVEESFDLTILKYAYGLGRDHAIIGDEVSSIDLLGNKEIIDTIRNKWEQSKK